MHIRPLAPCHLPGVPWGEISPRRTVANFRTTSDFWGVPDHTCTHLQYYNISHGHCRGIVNYSARATPPKGEWSSEAAGVAIQRPPCSWLLTLTLPEAFGAFKAWGVHQKGFDRTRDEMHTDTNPRCTRTPIPAVANAPTSTLFVAPVQWPDNQTASDIGRSWQMGSNISVRGKIDAAL